MKILCIGISEYIKRNILQFNEGNIQYNFINEENFSGINFIDNLVTFMQYSTILVGIDYKEKDELNLQKYADILTNVIYIISKSNNMKKVIFLSTYGVYKEKISNDPYKEDDTIQPQDYKSSLHYYYECMLKNACEKYSKQVIIVRLFNIFGLYQKDDFIITYLVNEMLTDKQELFLGDMRKKRDYIYIKELIVFINIIIDKNIEKNYEVYNFGMGASYSIKEIFEAIKKIIKKDKKIIFNPNKIRIFSDYNDVKADISKIKNDLNFQFQYSIYDAFSNFIELYKVNKESKYDE